MLAYCALLAAAIGLGLSQGAANIPWAGLWLKENQPILILRGLRTLTAILAGSGLAVSGVALQAVLRNPLAEPYLLGTSSGAGLAAVVAMILGLSGISIPLAALIGAIASIIVVYNLAGSRNKISDQSLILSGVIISVALSAIIVFLISVSGDKILHHITWWLWGSLEAYDARLVFLVAIPVILGIALIFVFAQDMDAIGMGEEEAMHLGVDATRVKKILIFLAALITACLICICGIIGFVGLIIPHMMRLVVGPKHRILIPFSCVAASVFMIVCDVISRTMFAPIEIPVGVVTALIGTPVFIILLKKGQRVS